MIDKRERVLNSGNSNIDKAIRDLEEKNLPITEKWDLLEVCDDKEMDRLKRMEQIRDQANNERVARCKAKKREVGGEAKFMDLIHSGEWNDSKGMTEIENEYLRLRIEQRNCEWLRDHGKPYRKEDDPSAKF